MYIFNIYIYMCIYIYIYSVLYSPQTKRCLLCLNEKLEIAAYKEQNLLNKRNEIISKC